MNSAVLIAAAPTPWDAGGRLAGNHTLPLTTDGEIALRDRLEGMTIPVAVAYTFRGSAACEQAARLVARRFDCRVHDAPLLEPISMGLWQGLTREELRFRFPSVFPEWEENPLSVNPPEGESVEAAAGRFRAGLRRIFRKDRGGPVALVLRPMSLQIAAGILRGEDLRTTAVRLGGDAAGEWLDVVEVPSPSVLDD